MKSAASDALAINNALRMVIAEDRGRIFARLIARFNNFQLAEDALHEAAASALVHWSRKGLPHSPTAWLLTVANRKAIDMIRKRSTEAQKAVDLVPFTPELADEGDEDEIPDDRLRLIFTCCHPALEQKSQLALTLRTIAGLTTIEIARAFLDQEATIAQRISRAKAKIAAAGIPYAVPGPDAWNERLKSVIAVIYLIFTTGYGAQTPMPRDLAGEAIFLARLLNQLRPGDPEVEGCLALLLITHARRDARVDDAGMTLPPDEQDRSRWHASEIEEGLALLDRAMQRRAPGPYQIKAAIAACHIAEDGVDWRQIALLYKTLIEYEPTAVVQVNRAVAVAKAGAVDAGLALLSVLDSDLGGYQPYHAARAELLSLAGDKTQAHIAFEQAITLSQSEADRALLAKRRNAIA